MNTRNGAGTKVERCPEQRAKGKNADETLYNGMTA